jgi:outer membrane protein TolC
LAESLQVAAAHRPERGFSSQAVVAAQEGVATAKAEFLPRFIVRASTGRVDGTNVLPGWQAGAGLHLEIPLYTGGRLSGDLHTAQAEVAAAVAEQQVILDAISLEVNRAFQSVVAAGQRIDLSRPAVDHALENLRLMRVKYGNGDATPTDIVDAETALTRSRQRLSSAVYTYLVALARLDYAMGREQRPRGSP